MASEVTASVFSIDPSILTSAGYGLSDQAIIPNENIISSFVPFQDSVEFWVYDLNKNLINGETNFTNYKLEQNPSPNEENDTSVVVVSPSDDAYNLGIDTGTLYTVYNFIRYELSSSVNQEYFLSEISSDRTEIRLSSNILSNEDITNSFNDLKLRLISSDSFDEFYLNFGENNYAIGINIELNLNGDQNTILAKLYEPLSPAFDLKTKLSVVTKPAESIGYEINWPDIIDIPLDITYLKGPNTNLELKDFINNSTELKSKSELLNTNSSASKDNLSYTLNEKGVKISPNYSYNTFSEFVNFSSAKKRIENFVEKLTQIQSYEADIEALNLITGSTSESFSVSSSIASAYSNIENLVKNFDGYEYYLYYNSSSFSYPKTGSSFPYTPVLTTSQTASEWLGSDIENSQYYGGVILSASLYDENNQNWLYYTIPEFIRDNEDNNQYLEFSNMVGQHFDEIWLYTKAVSQKSNTTSELDSGIPLKLADDVITSLGYKGFGNNFNSEGNYIGLTGEDNGSYVPPTGSEVIDNYIAVNLGGIVNYWNINYSYDDYVAQLEDPGYPYAIDKVSKEIFKRLYHNMSYLVKKKGTISGLRQLINIWGIPNTILRINEFGGKNKDESDDYDLWYNRYSYAFSPISTQHMPSASVVFPWMPLERNRIVDSEYIVPDNIQFRFKTTGYPSSSYAGEFFTQSLLVKKSDGDDTSTDMDFGIALFYTGSTSGSYSGSSSSEYKDWGIMRLYMSGSSADGGVAVSNDIYLPFFDKGWWSVMLQRNQHVSASDNSNSTTYTLYAKNKINNGFDGNSIGFEGSASIVSNISTSINEAWNKFGTGSVDGVYLGGFISGSNVGDEIIGESGKIISGSLQEFRYYSYALSESIFNDFVMNPESIEGINITGSLSSFDIVNFRAPLGNELESIFTSSFSSSYSESLTSMHPAITGAASLLITGSFVNPTGNVTSSAYDVLYYENSTIRTFSKTNTEVYFLDQPAIGIRNRISNKIQVEDAEDYGNTLSSMISIEQDYQISRSYTEDINSLEVAFSPQDEINDDIIQSFGYGVVADALADPRFISESLDYYPQLRKTAEDYFEKYTKGNVYDYLRLIKYFDNSIFKAIKNYVPARTSVSTGIVIKQHLLERNRYPQPQLTEVTKIAVTPSGGLNTPINLENLELTSSLSVGSFNGGAGGSVNKYNVPAGYFRLQDNNTSSPYTLTSGSAVRVFTSPVYSWIDTREDTFLDVSSSVIEDGHGFTNTNGEFTNYTNDNYTGDILFAVRNLGPGSGSAVSNVEVAINEVGGGVIASQTQNLPLTTTVDYGFNGITFESKKSYYFTLTTDTNTVIRRLTSIFNNNNANNFSGQAYSDSEINNLGIVEFANPKSEEFYDGEYSGSEVIATSQSLFNNPFTEVSATETTYNLRVGEYGPTVDYGTTKIDIRYWDSSIDTFETTVLNHTVGNGTGSVLWVTKSFTDSYEVAALALIDKDNAGGAVLFEEWDYVGASGNIYPSESFKWANDAIYSTTPMVRFSIADAISAGVARGDTFYSDLDYSQILLQGLVYKQFNTGNNHNGLDYEFYLSTDQGYPSTSGPGTQGSSRWIEGGSGFTIDEGCIEENIKYFSKSLVTQNYATSSLGFKAFNSASVGEGILYVTPANYYKTGSELDRWKPYAFSLNAIDSNGNDNTATLNQSNVNYNTPFSAVTTPFVDFSGLNSNIFNSVYLNEQVKTYSSALNSYYFQYNLIGGNSPISRNNSTITGSTSLISFDPYLDPSAINFENSDYYATLNNFNDNRQNSYIMNLEYDNGINTPSNLSLVKGGTAEKTQTPDSNYTMKKVTKPRYEGMKLQSVDYNFYTPAKTASFLDGTTGSWGGDISYGRTAVINKNPIYFAHFKSSKENYELWDSYTFRIDQLIQVPFEDIRGEAIEPSIIKIDGSNDNLSEVVSTFEKDRGVTVAYNRSLLRGVDYSSLSVGSNDIFQGGLEYNLIAGNEDERVNYVTSSFFVTSSWFRGQNKDFTYTGLILDGPYIGSIGKNYSLSTGSGYLILEGGFYRATSSYEIGQEGVVVQQDGPGLGLLHTLNVAVSRSQEMSYNTGSSTYGGLGIPKTGSNSVKPLNPKNELNYSYFTILSGSEMSSYEDFKIPFIIKKGDEIRVTYNSVTGSDSVPIYEEQDFLVTSVERSGSGAGASGDYEARTFKGGTSVAASSIMQQSIWNKLRVSPDPSTLTLPIHDGEINNFTIRRRIEADDRVMVYQLAPPNSLGNRTLSGQGYLIPNDLSPSQKRNVQTLINQLTGKNQNLDSLDVETTSSS